MMKIRSQMPKAVQFRPRKAWWPRFISYWRALEKTHGPVARQDVLTDLICRGLDDAEMQLEEMAFVEADLYRKKKQ